MKAGFKIIPASVTCFYLPIYTESVILKRLMRNIKPEPVLFILIAALFVLPLITCGCRSKTADKSEQRQTSKKPDLGIIEGSTYKNNYFGFGMEIPYRWNAQDKKARQKIKESDAAAGQEKYINAFMTETRLERVTLLTAFRHQAGSTEHFNANMICAIEKMENLDGIKTAKDYLCQAKTFLSTSSPPPEFPLEIYKKPFDGVVFDVLYMQTVLPDETVKQNCYSTIIKGYALSFFISYTTENELTDLNSLMNSIKFHLR